jgi:arabinogalactan endo-1,4-beta-galactosidase
MIRGGRAGGLSGIAIWVALLSACGAGAVSPPDSGTTLPLALERIEQSGGVFRDAGVQGDAIAILQAHGSNLFRLRLFVNPSGQEVEVNDLAYTLRMASRIKAAGAGLLLDLHYSDTWADPGHQLMPSTWASFDSTALEQEVERYSADAVAQLKQEGALPDIVQIGNEIDGGILWPQGQVSYGSDSSASWNRFTRLLKAGIRGVRGALGPGDSVRIMLHFSQGGDAGGTAWFFDHMNAYGVPYDLIGLSYYPWWHGPIGNLKANLQATALRYGRDIMVVETSYPWRAGGWESVATNRAAMTWPASLQGQAKFLRDVRDAVATVPGGHGVGLVWWYPEAIQVPGIFIWGGGSLSLFDAGGSLLPAASELRAR